MKKLKLKKKARNGILISIVVIILLSGGLYSYFNIKKEKDYEKTDEYQLEQVGYNTEEIKILKKIFVNKELDFFKNNKKKQEYIDLIQEKHFIKDNFNTYLEYLQNNRNMTASLAVEKVNTQTNKEFYTDPVATDTSKEYLMLINKYHYLTNDYTPELVTIPPTYSFGEIGSQKATQDTYDAFLNLWAAGRESGFYLMVNSSYRSYQKQEEIYNKYRDIQGIEYADELAARPGYSEHQSGYALNITMNGYTDTTFKDTDAYNWLVDNAYKYGFILRYPSDKEEITGFAFESGHLRYVGIEAATYIYENHITFDEYYAYFVK